MFNKTKLALGVWIRSQPRQDVLTVGQQAAECGKPFEYTKRFQAAVAWLVANDLATITSGNKLALLSSSLQTVTSLAGPSKLKELDDSKNSVWGLRQKLNRLSWSSGPASQASASAKHYNANNSFKQYLCLLLGRILIAKTKSECFLFLVCKLPNHLAI